MQNANIKHEVEAVSQLLMNARVHVFETIDCDNTTRLMSAVYEGDTDSVKVFVARDELDDIHSRNVDNCQATDIASYCGHIHIVEFLRKYLTCKITSFQSFSGNYNTAEDVTSGLLHIRQLLENGANVEAENVDGLRPVHYAVRTGLVELVQLLIQHGANVDAADVYGNRPLHEAVCIGQNVVKLLVDHGAKVNIQNIHGKTPLHVAIERQESEVIVLLLNTGADVGLTDVWRNTPLHYLSTSDTLEKFAVKQINHSSLICNAVGVTVQLLVAARVPSDCYGNTPLHYTVGVYAHLKLYRVSTDVTKTVDYLVECGTDINAQNNDGFTPLHVARGKEAILACLKHADDQSFAITDKRGRNFWHLLFLLRNLNETALTRNIEAMMSKSSTKHCSDDLNRTPLHYVCMKRNVSISRELLEKFVESFGDNHINQQDRFGRTALHYAAMTDDIELVKLLRKKNAIDDMIQDDFEKTAIDYEDCHVMANHPVLQLKETFDFVRKNFDLIFSRIDQCFCKTSRHLESSKTELRKLICDKNDITSFMVKLYQSCRCNYSDMCNMIVAWKQYKSKLVDLVDDNNKSATQPTITFTAIQRQVDSAMQHLAKEMSNKDKRFTCKVVPVGSAYEETRIAYCDEFDYNFVLTDLSTKCEVCYSPESPPGFVLLKAAVPEYEEDLFNSSGILNTRIVKFKFETLVKQVLSSLSFCEATGFEFIDPVQDFPVLPGTTSTKLNTVIKLRFIQPVNEYQVLHNISVDVVPVLHIDGWWPDDMRREDLCQAGDCIIVFTQPQNKYPWIGWTEPHGFISFAQAESRLLRDCPCVIKAAFMVVKRMSQYFVRKYEFFSSHVIKTALLWCLDEVEPANKCLSLNCSDEISGDELLHWVQNIVQRLLCFAAQDYVPCYFMPKCHQPVWLKEKYLKQFHMRLYRHGLSEYSDLFSLNKQQSCDYWLKYIKSLITYSHVMYWMVSCDDSELKLFVPSTINPLTENDVCTPIAVLPND